MSRRTRKFKGSRTSTSFKNLGSGLRAAEGRITEQRKVEIDALKLQAEQARANDQLQIRGLADKASFEEGVIEKKHNLENISRTRQYEALSLTAERDVQRLRDIAKQKKERAEYLEQLAPKQAEALMKVGEGAIAIAQHFESNALRDAYDESQGADEAEKSRTLAKQLSTWKLLNSKANTEADGSTGRHITNFALNEGSRNPKFLKEQYAIFQDNRVSNEAEVKSLVYKYLRPGENDIDEAYKFAARMKLEELNVHSDSDIGRKIIRQYVAWGRLEKQRVVNVKDQGDTQSTLTRLADVIHAEMTSLSQLEGKELDNAWTDINIMFNQGVLESARGTHKVGNDFQVGLPDGLGGGYSHFLGVFLQTHGHKYDTKVLKEHLARLKTRDDSAESGLTNEFYTIKHDQRTEDAFTDYNTWLDTAAKKALKVNKAEYNKFTLTIAQEKEAILNDPEGPGYITEDQRLKWIEQIHASNAHNKSELYKLVGFDAKGYSDVGKVLAAKRAFEDGDINELENILDSMSTKEKEKLESDIKIYQRMKIADPDGSFLKGDDSKEAIKTLGKGFSSLGSTKLTQSGEGASRFHKRLVLDRFKELKGSHPDEEQIYSTAIAQIKKEYLDTAAEIRWNPKINQYELVNSNKGDLSNPFNYVSPRGGIAGIWKPHAAFPHFDDADQTNVYKIQEYYNSSPDMQDVNVKDINLDMKGVQIKELDDNTIKYSDYEKVLAHPRLISPDKFWEFEKVLKEEINNPGSVEDLTEYMPYTLKVLADSRPDKTRVEVLNDYLKQKRVFERDAKGPKWFFKEDREDQYRISANGQDAARINNNGVVVNPPNIYGYNLYNAAKAQGITPKSYYAEEFLIDQSLTNSELFSKSIGVEWSIDPESNTPISTDFKKWAEEGGFFHNPPEEWVMSIGLLNWDDSVGWTGTDEQRAKRLDIYNRKEQIRLERLKADFKNPLTRRSK